VRTTSSAYDGSASVGLRVKSDGRSRIVPAMRRQAATVSVSKMLAFWNLRPRPKRTHSSGGKVRMSWPHRFTPPAVRSAPSLMQRISVVLPAPFGPIKPTSCPSSAARSMPCRTFKWP